MKKHILTLMLFLSGTMLFAQDEEWKAIVDLLKEEATYFDGKKGRMWGVAHFTDFKYEKLEIKSGTEYDTIFYNVHQYGYRESLEAHLTTEILIFEPYVDIKSVQILYENGTYFYEYPKYLYLKIEMVEPLFFHKTVASVKNTSTGETGEMTDEEVLDVIVLPIRAENREKIFKAIDAYQISAYLFKLNQH